jgi:hypothetical protein
MSSPFSRSAREYGFASWTAFRRSIMIAFEHGALQQRMEEHRANGYAPEAAFGCAEAWRILTRYVQLPPTELRSR